MQVSNRMSYNIVLVDFRSTATLLKWSVMMQEIQAVRRWDRLDTNPQISQTNSEATQTRWTIKNHTSGISAEIVCLGSEGFFCTLCVHAVLFCHLFSLLCLRAGDCPAQKQYSLQDFPPIHTFIPQSHSCVSAISQDRLKGISYK